MPEAELDPEELAVLLDRLRTLLPSTGLRKQRMFGGIAFMLNDHMSLAASRRGLLVRVGKEAYAEAVERPGASPMEMRGGPVDGYVRVETARLDDSALAQWVNEAVAFVRTLPTRSAAPKSGRRSNAGADTKRS